MPEVYDRVLGPALFAPYAEQLALRAAALAPTRVLELAAGTGIATTALVAAGLDVVATDLNPAMVAWGAERVPGATWQLADAQEQPFPDDAFDLVVCQFGAMFFPDRPAAYAEAARVLAPGGALLLAVWDEVATSDLPAALVACLNDLFPEDPPTFVARIPHGYADPAVITADLVAGGLPDVSVERVELRGGPVLARDAAEGFGMGTPLRFALQERGNLETLVADLGDAMEARLGRDPVHGALAAFVVTARGASGG